MKRARISIKKQLASKYVSDKWHQQFVPNSEFLKQPWELNTDNVKVYQDFFEYFSRNVPVLLEKIYINGILKYSIKEREFTELICKNFERFICGKEHNDSFSGLQVYNKPSKFCGKVFGVGDPTYTCKDCAADPTCVFCHECFHQSSHKNHKYRMHASYGSGGYCDCGDKEAWSTDPACLIHQEGLSVDESWDPLITLPREGTLIYDRALLVLTFLLQYCVDLLCWQENDQLPFPLTMITEKNDSDSHIVMLFNDESHTFDEVSNTLERAIKASNQQAFHYAAVVDKEGRSSIYNGDKESCQSVVEVCRKHLAVNGKGPLKCEAIHRDVVAHQLNAMLLLRWLNNVVDKSGALRRLLVHLVCNTMVHREEPLVDVVIQMDTEFWKRARNLTHQLFMNALMVDTVGRIQFSIKFAEFYQQMVKDFMGDDHDHTLSVTSLSVQIFTVPTIAEMLMLEHNIFKVCLETYWNNMQAAIGKNGYLDFTNAGKVDIRRLFYVLNDLRYLLRNKPKWTSRLRERFLDGFHIFVKILRVMQGMDSVKRVIQYHITYEPNWNEGFDLQLYIMPLVELMIAWCCSDLEVLKASMKICIDVLKEVETHQIVQGNSVFIDIIKHDVTTNLVSVHYALSRFIAGLLPGASKYSLTLEEILSLDKIEELPKHELVLKMIEYPLRALVLVAQVHAQMWKRNGYAILHQVTYYQEIRFVSEMFDRDIQMLQAIAAIICPDDFIQLLLHKYNLLDWARSEYKGAGEAAQTTQRIADDFILILLYILSERFHHGVGCVTSKKILEREVIHRLSLGAISRSDLVKKLPSKDPEDDEDCSHEDLLDGVLKAVAIYKEPGVTGKGLYKLKNECLLSCNPYFIHFTKTERSKVLEIRRKFIRDAPNSEVIYLADPPNFVGQFQPVTRLLTCERMYRLLQLCLARYVDDDKCSEEQVEQVLLILAVGLIEVKRIRCTGSVETNDMAIKYMDLITRIDIGGKSIQQLLGLLCSKNTKEYSSCARWVLKLMNEEIFHLPNNSMEVEDMEDKSVEDMITEQDEKAKKKRLAEERRQKMMAQMNNMQKAFMRKYSNVFSDTEEEMNETPISEEISWYPSNHLTVIGPDTSSPEANDIVVVCMLCQEEESIEIHTNPFVVTCFLQKSSLLMNRQSLTENGDNKVEPVLNNMSSLNISSCGHVIHHKCWDKYYISVKEREIGDHFVHRRQRTCIDVMAHEYLCPLCNSLCNTVLPLLPRLQDTQSSSVKEHLGLAEFLAYLERFSAEIMPRNMSRKGTRRATRQDSSLSITGTLWRFIERFSSERDTSSENFMELLPKRLMKLLGLSDENVLHAIPLTWMVTSFTFQAIECRCRESGENIFTDISDRHAMFLRSLVQYLSSSCLITYLDPIETYCRTLLDFFLNTSIERDNSLNILDADIFGMFISLHYIVSILQNIFQEKTPGFKTIPQCLIDDVIAKLCIRTFIVRISVICPVFYGEDTANTSVEDETVLSTWQHIRGLLKMDVPKASSINQSLLKDYFTRSLVVFLRCTALFLHYHTDIRLPDGFKQDVIDGEMKQLLQYLNLPDSIDEILSLEWVLGEPQMETMVNRWCQNKKLLDDMNKRDTPICRPFVQSRRLYRLPENYSTLINMASQFKCPTDNDNSRSPSLCLICGSLLCSKCFYCQTENEHYGACSRHIMTCGNGVGIFLPIRESEVVLLFNQSKGAYMSSPYLDEYGEPDRGFKRGNPLFLNKKRYNKLEQLWLQHNIPQTIAQLTESNRNMLAYEWNAF